MLHEKEMIGSETADKKSKQAPGLSDKMSKRFRDIIADMYRLGYL